MGIAAVSSAAPDVYNVFASLEIKLDIDAAVQEAALSGPDHVVVFASLFEDPELHSESLGAFKPAFSRQKWVSSREMIECPEGLALKRIWSLIWKAR